MTDIVEVANKLYNRNYLSFSRGSGQFGEVLTFKGTAGELTILESEMQFHLKRTEEKDKKKAIPADFKFKREGELGKLMDEIQKL